MKELKCPKCGTAITVNDADFADILNQVRTAEFNAEVARRVAAMKEVQIAQEAKKSAEEKVRFQKEMSDKERAIAALQEQIKAWELNKGLEMEALRLKAQQAVADAVARKEDEIRKKEAEISRLNDAVELYKNFKAKRSVKLLGEDLEQHCYALYNQMLLPVMPGATFEKDNESVKEEGETSGTKGDFIFRDKEDGVEYLSIMFEMKNEGDVSATRHRNADFYAKLDSDRKKKGCEYAVLVSMLELDNDLFSGINVVPGYEKMFMVRPDQFIPIITLLVQSAKNSLEAKKQLVAARNQSIDLSKFEDQLLAFRDAFGKNVLNAKKKYDEAIEGIDKTIKTMEAIKKALQVSSSHLDAAENKVEGLTIKKLTRGNPTVTTMIEEARKKKKENSAPDEQ